MNWIEIPLEFGLYILVLYVFWLIINMILTFLKTSLDAKMSE